LIKKLKKREADKRPVWREDEDKETKFMYGRVTQAKGEVFKANYRALIPRSQLTPGSKNTCKHQIRGAN
jgi:hypothetical protein